MSFHYFLDILAPLYQPKDPAHGIGHIRRIYAKALVFSKGRKPDMAALSLGAALHGLVAERKPEAQGLLLMGGVPAELLEKAMVVAAESQTDAVPKSIEGKILHDAHLCEGGGPFPGS